MTGVVGALKPDHSIPVVCTNTDRDEHEKTQLGTAQWFDEGELALHTIDGRPWDTEILPAGSAGRTSTRKSQTYECGVCHRTLTMQFDEWRPYLTDTTRRFDLLEIDISDLPAGAPGTPTTPTTNPKE
jgi:hypothetical protein